MPTCDKCYKWIEKTEPYIEIDRVTENGRHVNFIVYCDVVCADASKDEEELIDSGGMVERVVEVVDGFEFDKYDEYSE